MFWETSLTHYGCNKLLLASLCRVAGSASRTLVLWSPVNSGLRFHSPSRTRGANPHQSKPSFVMLALHRLHMVWEKGGPTLKYGLPDQLEDMGMVEFSGAISLRSRPCPRSYKLPQRPRRISRPAQLARWGDSLNQTASQLFGGGG